MMRLTIIRAAGIAHDQLRRREGGQGGQGG